MLKMTEITLDFIKSSDKEKFASILVKNYYDAARELISTILLLDGLKTYGEGAHKKLIEHIGANYKLLDEYELSLLEELRNIRNRIAYEGFL